MFAKLATIARRLQGRSSNTAVGYGLTPYSLYERDFLHSLGELVSGGADLSNYITVAFALA